MKGIQHLLTKDKIARESKEIVYISARSYPTENIQLIIYEFLNLTQFPIIYKVIKVSGKDRCIVLTSDLRSASIA